MDCSPPGSSVHGIFQARVPDWVAMAFSDGMKMTVLIIMTLMIKTMNDIPFATPTCYGKDRKP